MNKQKNRKRQFHCVEGNNRFLSDSEIKRTKFIENNMQNKKKFIENNMFKLVKSFNELNIPNNIVNSINSYTLQISKQSEQTLSIITKVNNIEKKIKSLTNPLTFNIITRVNNIETKMESLTNRLSKIEKILESHQINERPKFTQPCSYIA